MENNNDLPGPVHIEYQSSPSEQSHIHSASSSQPNTFERYKSLFLPVAILIGAILVSGTILYSKNRTSTDIQATPKPLKANIVLKADDHILGNQNAKVAIVIFSDFQCPFCRSFWSNAYAQIKKEYVDTGKAKFVFRHYPLSFHPSAQLAAVATECANVQGKFWEMHDKIFEEQTKLNAGQQLTTIQFTKQNIIAWAAQIGLKNSTFNQCLNADTYTARIQSDFEYGSSIGIEGTPTIFVNGRGIVGAQPFSVFQEIIDDNL